MRSLEFASDSARLLVLHDRELHAITLAGDQRLEIPVSGVHAFAGIGDRIWVASGSPVTLQRFRLDGTLDGSTQLPMPLDAPRLVPASGGAIVGWIAAPCALVTATASGLSSVELPREVEFVLPLSATRLVVATRTKLELREQHAVRWSISLGSSVKILDGARVLDGNAVALNVSTTGGQAVLVIGLREGALLHRISIPERAPLRFAAKRGVALLCVERTRLVVIDLRFGRVILDRDEGREIDDLAIDDAGRQIALRLRDGAQVIHIPMADLVAAAGSAPSSPPLAAAAPSVEEPEPVDHASNGVGEPSLAPAAADQIDPFGAAGCTLGSPALPQRIRLPAATPEQITALLSLQRDVAVALVTLAIARAWDEGRLAHVQSTRLPFHSEVTGIAAGHAGLAIDEVVNANDRLENALAAAGAAHRALRPAIGPLDALAIEHGLSPAARDILLLVAAPSLWGELARLYGILGNDEARAIVDEQLLCAILAERCDPQRIALELDVDAPLIRLGIIRERSGHMRPFLPLVLDPVVLKLLRGAPVEAELEPLVRSYSSSRTFDELRIPTATKQAIAANLSRATPPLRIAIRGRMGSGRHTLLAAIAAASGRTLAVIDASMIVREPRTRMPELVVALERSLLAGMLPCVDGLELIASDDVIARDQVREVLQRHPGPLAVRTTLEAPIPLAPGFVAIDLPALSLTDRATCWTRSLVAHRLEVRELVELADRYAVGPGVIERVTTEIARSPVEGDAGALLETAIRQYLENRLGATANRVGRLSSWAQVILPPDIQDSLTELIARIKHRRQVFDLWGFNRVMSTSRGVTALFQGGPGTGKTMVASAIANELGMDLYRVDLSRVMSKWIGETEQNLAKLFDAAEDGNAIILFDEADSLFAKRTEVKSSVDRYANLEVNYLLQRIDSFEGIAILTTNFGTSIDAAFKRRLSLRLTFPFPDDEMREKLWKAHLPPEVPVSGPLDFQEISRKYRLSGGYIRNCVLRAAFLAVEEHTPLSMDHLERAIKAEFREIGKIAESGVLE
ncbi:MAG: ATP-binding protein [Myxococcales bacterium]|nr:ATP-binding protein [Myxococcales bacterium]